jgi:hypothetical protein
MDYTNLIVWLLSCGFGLLVKYINHFDNFQFLVLTILFAIFLNTSIGRN